MKINFLNKFYDIEVPTGVTTGTTTATQSIAELMATQGIFNNNEELAAMPTPIGESTPPQGQEQVAAPVVSTTADPASQPEVVTEAPKPKMEEVSAPPAAIEQPQATTTTWQESISQQPITEVLKAIGFNEGTVKLVSDLKELDPKMVNFLNVWKDNGDVTAYLKELSTNYMEMPPEEVMRHQLRAEYPKATDKQFDVLYQKKIVEGYKLDPENFTEEEVEMGKLLLEAEADKYRDNFVTKQNEFLLPKPPEPKEVIPEVNQAELQREAGIKAYKEAISNSDYTKSLQSSKAFSLGEGDEKFSYPIEPNELTDILFDDKKWAEGLFIKQPQADGSIKYAPDVEKQMLLAAVHVHGMKFLTEYAKHYRSLGAAQALSPIENASIPNHQQTTPFTQTQPKTNAEAMARGGRVVNGNSYY